MTIKSSPLLLQFLISVIHVQWDSPNTAVTNSDVKFHEIIWREIFHEIFREIFLKCFKNFTMSFFRAVHSPV